MECNYYINELEMELGVIYYEQRSMVTKWGKQASRVADARKIGFRGSL
jgi:hypothetical protein